MGLFSFLDPSAVAAGTQQQQPQPQQPTDPLAQYRPGLLGTLMAGFSHPGGFNQVRDAVTMENVNRAMMPVELAMRQQALTYGAGIQDPALRNLYFTNPAAYAEVMKGRLSPHDTSSGAITTGLGGNGDQAVNGSVTLKPGEALTNTGGQPITSAPMAPMTVAPSESVYDPVSKTFRQAPAKPEVVKTAPGETTDVITPGAGGQTGPAQGGGDQSRGARNNNPWNVTTLGGNQRWNGQTGSDGQFAQFGSVQAGAQAADRNLQSYALLHDINTVRGAISRWAPPNENNTDAYVQGVSQAMDVGPDQPINLQDPTVRAKMLQSMLPFEMGRTGGAQPSQPQAQGASVTPIRQGAMPQDIAPAEAIAKGLAPGRWQRMPDGSEKLVSPAPKGDVERVNNLMAAASTMDDLMDLDSQFMDAAKRTKPGLLYAGGDHFNPIARMAEHVNPDVKTMESIGAQELFKMKPENAGARVLQSELPFWQRSALDAGSTLEANQGLAAQHASQAAQIKAKAEFYQQWLYQHGSLNGADQAWAKAKPAPPSNAAPKKTKAGPPPAQPANFGGYRIISQQ